MKGTEPTPHPEIEAAKRILEESGELISSKPDRFFKVRIFLLRVKNFFPELYYASRQHYFIERCKIEKCDEPIELGRSGSITHKITESEYVKINPKTNKVEYVQYPRHATAFTFLSMVIFVHVLNKKRGSKEYRFSSVTVGDVAFVHHCHTGEHLFPLQKQSGILALSPIVIFGLSLILAGLITLLQYYTHQ